MINNGINNNTVILTSGFNLYPSREFIILTWVNVTSSVKIKITPFGKLFLLTNHTGPTNTFTSSQWNIGDQIITFID